MNMSLKVVIACQLMLVLISMVDCSLNPKIHRIMEIKDPLIEQFSNGMPDESQMDRELIEEFLNLTVQLIQEYLIK